MMNNSLNIADSLTGYPKYINTDSFVDFVLINELAKNVDAYRLSTFLYKDRDSRNPKLFAGPIWDYNLAFGNSYYYEGGISTGWQIEYLTNPANMPPTEPFLTPFWWRKLFDDSKFRNNVFARWQILKSNVLNTQHLFNYIDSLVQLLDESKTRNFERWPVLGTWVWPNYFVGQTYEQEINYLKSWTANRINWLDQNMIGEPTDINETNHSIPSDFSLEQNYPNPFNPVTNISYSVPIEILITIRIYDILGNEIVTLVNETKAPGKYSIKLRAIGMTSGVYYYRMISEDFISTRKLILLK